MTNSPKYSTFSRLLHWVIAALIIIQYVLIELVSLAASHSEIVQQLALLANHKSIGMTVLALSVLRLSWRIFNPPPDLPSSMSERHKNMSFLAHWLIYFLIFMLPLSGWLMSSANAYSVSWFNLFVFPDLIAGNERLSHFLNDTHEILSKLLFGLVVIHVCAALKHHYFDKDDVLNRMASIRMWGVLFLTLILVLFFFARIAPSAVNNGLNVDSASEIGAHKVTLNSEEKVSDLPVWNIDYSTSYIRFEGDQAGAPFEGVWTKWTAMMQFDPNQISNSQFDVLIDVTQVDSGDSERDGYIIGSDFFDASNYKTARFYVADFSKISEGRFSSNGYLTIKGLKKSVLFEFSLVSEGDKVVLNGFASLDRLAWNIGIGDWSDPTWVGGSVNVRVKVEAIIDE